MMNMAKITTEETVEIMLILETVKTITRQTILMMMTTITMTTENPTLIFNDTC